VVDSATVALVQTSHMLSESLEKTEPHEAVDRFLGEAFVERYADWVCVRQIKPRGLKLFQLVVLARVVHMHAPTYTPLRDNCFWFVGTVLDGVEALGVDLPTTPEDTRRKAKYLFDSDMPGRWRGLKITTTDQVEVSVILSKYQEALDQQLEKV